MAAGVAGAARRASGQRTPQVRQLGHGDAVHAEASPFDEAEHAQHRALSRREIRSSRRTLTSLFSIIWTFELLGGTSGQTFSRGSIRAWQRIGPARFQQALDRAGTSDRWSMVKASMPNDARDFGEIGIVAEVDLGEILVEEQLLPLPDHAELRYCRAAGS